MLGEGDGEIGRGDEGYNVSFNNDLLKSKQLTIFSSFSRILKARSSNSAAAEYSDC